MLIKSGKGKGFSGVVKYVFEGKLENRGIDEKQAEIVGHSDNLLVPYDGHDKEGIKACYQDFKEQASRGNCIEPVGHHKVNFNDVDRALLNDEKIAEVIRDYIQERGLENTQWLAVRHHDTEHEHVHVVFNRVDNNGKVLETDRFKENTVLSVDLSEKHGLTADMVSRSRVKEWEDLNPNFRNDLNAHRRLNEKRVKAYDGKTIAQRMNFENPILQGTRNMAHLKGKCRQGKLSFEESGDKIVIGGKDLKKQDVEQTLSYNNVYYQQNKQSASLDEKETIAARKREEEIRAERERKRETQYKMKERINTENIQSKTRSLEKEQQAQKEQKNIPKQRQHNMGL